MWVRSSFIGLVLSVTALSTQAASQQTDSVAPETGVSERLTGTVAATAEKFMVVTANPLATDLGYEVLKQGGHAMDAMVAVQAMLGLVEPQSSGLGGGAFLVYLDAKTGQLTTFDAREAAPLAVTPELFQDQQGEPLKFYDAVVGGRSVGTPGTPKLMFDMHQRYGKLSWSELLGPSIQTAEEGFDVSPRLAASIASDAERLSRYPETAAYFFNTDGSPRTTGQRLVNVAYADTLKVFAKNGVEPFYKGKLGEAMVNKIASIPDNPGFLSLIDLQSYEVKERPPICVDYREYEVCGMGPPSSGALTLGQILGVLNNFDLSALGAESPEAWRLIGEASRLAFADRGRYIADTDFVPIPEGLLDPAYLAERAALILPGAVLESVTPGEPRWGKVVVSYADDNAIELPSTSHFSIVDAEGNIVSMTTTIENGFGSRVMSQGFLLNNELTDFSFSSYSDGLPIANRVEPGKRPRSSMAPTILLKDGQPYMAIGSPGGSRIIGYVANALISHIDWGKDIQASIEQPHLVNRFGTYDIEAGTPAVNLQPALEALGYKVSVRDLNSGLHAIQLTDGGLRGGADPRREGTARGD